MGYRTMPTCKRKVFFFNNNAWGAKHGPDQLINLGYKKNGRLWPRKQLHHFMANAWWKWIAAVLIRWSLSKRPKSYYAEIDKFLSLTFIVKRIQLLTSCLIRLMQFLLIYTCSLTRLWIFILLFRKTYLGFTQPVLFLSSSLWWAPIN